MDNLNEKPLAPLPPNINFETAKILKAVASASSSVAELKGTATILPDQGMLMDMLLLQEVLAKSGTVEDKKEVASCYRNALRLGYNAWDEQQRISRNMLIVMFQFLKQYSDGYRYRETPGTVLRNQQTGKVVYTPPQGEQQIAAYMHDLEAFINGNKYSEIHPLIKMTLIHHQFESIQPFPDSNGYIGQMLNTLYLIHTGLLDAPILYLGQIINYDKPEYYRMLQTVHDESLWEDWIVYMLNVVTVTAESTLKLISDIYDLMHETEERMQQELKFCSRDLLNNLFRYPCTRIDYVVRDLGVHYSTAARYIKELTASGFVREEKDEAGKCYINQGLINLLFSNVLGGVPTMDAP